MDWKLYLFILLLALGIGYIWFDNIRWTIRFWRKEGLNKSVDKISGEVINNAQNDKGDYNPEPNSMFSVEFIDCLTNLDTKPYEKGKQATPTQGDCRSLRRPSNVFICLFGHVKSIIRWLNTKCKQNPLFRCYLLTLLVVAFFVLLLGFLYPIFLLIVLYPTTLPNMSLSARFSIFVAFPWQFLQTK